MSVFWCGRGVRVVSSAFFRYKSEHIFIQLLESWAVFYHCLLFSHFHHPVCNGCSVRFSFTDNELLLHADHGKEQGVGKRIISAVHTGDRLTLGPLKLLSLLQFVPVPSLIRAQHTRRSIVTGTTQYSTVQCSAVQCSAVQCSAVQCSAVQCSAVQCSTVQYSTLQHSAVQYSAVQFSSVMLFSQACLSLTGPLQSPRLQLLLLPKTH